MRTSRITLVMRIARSASSRPPSGITSVHLPSARGAHEYIGEAYLVADDLAKAEEHLAALQNICLIPCEEFEELKEKIEQYKSSRKQ